MKHTYSKLLGLIGGSVFCVGISHFAHAQMGGGIGTPPPAPAPLVAIDAISPNPTTSNTISVSGTVTADDDTKIIARIQYRVTDSSDSTIIDSTDATPTDGSLDSASEDFAFSFTLPAPGTYHIYADAIEIDDYGDEYVGEETQDITYQTASASPSPSPTPEITPTPSPTPDITPSPTPDVTPTPEPSPSDTPSPTPEITPTPESSSAGSDQGPGGDCCAHDDDRTARATIKHGKVLGATTSPFTASYNCALLPIIYPTFLTTFNLELNFPESDYWSYRVKNGVWQDISNMLYAMLWHKQKQETYDKKFDASNKSINNRCVNQELITSINWIFQDAYGRRPNASEYGYWYRRLMRIEKISVPDLFGAMQWQKLHDRDHSNDINIVRDFTQLFSTQN